MYKRQTVGSSTTLLLNDNFIPSFTIKNINDINWNNFDTLIIGHLGELSNLIDKDNLLRSIMLTAKKHNKNLFLFDDVSKYDIFDHYTMYVPRVCKEDVNNNYLGMLYYISKPCLLYTSI